VLVSVWRAASRIPERAFDSNVLKLHPEVYMEVNLLAIH
jgi:hypothetical protein